MDWTDSRDKCADRQRQTHTHTKTHSSQYSAPIRGQGNKERGQILSILFLYNSHYKHAKHLSSLWCITAVPDNPLSHPWDRWPDMEQV